eukprot:Skav228869  [mRNA]  locus=scaffold816:363888:366087:+ [translate_table: standard]
MASPQRAGRHRCAPGRLVPGTIVDVRWSLLAGGNRSAQRGFQQVHQAAEPQPQRKAVQIGPETALQMVMQCCDAATSMTESGNYHVDFLLPEAAATSVVEGDPYKSPSCHGRKAPNVVVSG